MLSRVAESIFWMSRYLERAENTARYIEVNMNLLLDLPVGVEEQWEPLVNTTGDRVPFGERYGTPSRENVIHFLSFDAENPNSILSCLRSARENARSVREIITSEMWECVNTFYLKVTQASMRSTALESPHDFFSQVKEASHLFDGITDATMSRGEGWHFGRMGRLIERADKTSRILDVKYYILLPSVADIGTPYDDIQWSALLHSASGFEMYRKCFGRISPRNVVDFLVLNREFPRAVQWCLMMADESLHAITGTPADMFRNPAEQKLGQLRSSFSFLHVDEILSQGLHEFVDALQTRLNQAGEAIHQTFFAHRPVAGAVTTR